MNWGSAGEFFAMGGYGLYVWGSMIVTFGALAVEILAVRSRRKTAHEQLRRWVRNAQRNGNENKA